MSTHMLVEFPLAIGIGALLAVAVPRLAGFFGRIDRVGLTGWLYATLALLYWMIPAALDEALASATINGIKFASLGLAGFALRSGWRRSSPIAEAFFVGNFVLMSATVGLVYQAADAQLCVNYLAESQQRAGSGLVVAALACASGWVYARRQALGLVASPTRSARTAAGARRVGTPNPHPAPPPRTR